MAELLPPVVDTTPKFIIGVNDSLSADTIDRGAFVTLDEAKKGILISNNPDSLRNSDEAYLKQHYLKAGAIVQASWDTPSKDFALILQVASNGEDVIVVNLADSILEPINIASDGKGGKKTSVARIGRAEKIQGPNEINIDLPSGNQIIVYKQSDGRLGIFERPQSPENHKAPIRHIKPTLQASQHEESPKRQEPGRVITVDNPTTLFPNGVDPKTILVFGGNPQKANEQTNKELVKIISPNGTHELPAEMFEAQYFDKPGEKRLEIRIVEPKHSTGVRLDGTTLTINGMQFKINSSSKFEDPADIQITMLPPRDVDTPNVIDMVSPHVSGHREATLDDKNPPPTVENAKSIDEHLGRMRIAWRNTVKFNPYVRNKFAKEFGYEKPIVFGGQVDGRKYTNEQFYVEMYDPKGTEHIPQELFRMHIVDYANGKKGLKVQVSKDGYPNPLGKNTVYDVTLYNSGKNTLLVGGQTFEIEVQDLDKVPPSVTVQIKPHKSIKK